MIDYLINVGLSFLPYFTFGVWFWIGVIVLHTIFKDKVKELPLFKSEFRKIFTKGVLIYMIIALFAVAMNSANTFKLEQHDKVILNQKIQTYNTNRQSGEIVDRTKKPQMTEDERAKQRKRRKIVPCPVRCGGGITASE